MTAAEKKRRQIVTVGEIDKVIAEGEAELRQLLKTRHASIPENRKWLHDSIKRMAHVLYTQRWIRSMVVRGFAGSLGLTA